MQTILVIDDDESLRDTIAVMLEQEGFRAAQAGDGRQGFEMALSLKPDLVLVDLRLPQMSGTEIGALRGIGGGPRDGDGGAQLVIGRVAVGDDDVEAIGRAALEDGDEDFLAL